MARTRSRDYHDKRQRILDRAAELFATKGFAGSSIAELARHCGASKSWLYHYYPSKEAILNDILLDHMTLLLATAKQAAASVDEPERQLRAVLRGLLSIYPSATHKHAVLLNELKNLSADQQTEIVGLERQVVDLVADLLQQVNPDLVTAGTRMPVTMMLFGMINWTYTWYRPDGPMSPEAFATLAADLFLHGLHGTATEAMPASLQASLSPTA